MIHITNRIPIGTSIELTHPWDNATPGMRGVVRGYSDNLLAIEFDDQPSFTTHSCDGEIPSGRGYWVSNSALKVINLSTAIVRDLKRR